MPSPQSQIQFVDSHTLAPRPEINIGRVITSSKGLGWRGIHVETGKNSGFRTDDVTVPQHYFAMNIGAPFDWEWKDGGTRFRKERSQLGTIWINPAGIPFSHRVYGHNQFALLTLDPKHLLEGLPEGTSIDHQAFARDHHSTDAQIQHIMGALVGEAAAGSPNGQIYIDLLSTALSIHYANHYRLKGPLVDSLDLSVVKLGDHKRIRKVTDYIEAFLTEDISLNDLALVAGLSKFHFSRMFKAAVGSTPHQYLMKRRVERAACALAKETASITEIAIAHGFADQTHFTRNFKKIKGITPGKFRREHS